MQPKVLRKIAGKSISDIFGSAGQEPIVPAPRRSDVNPFLASVPA
jgi:hypothetical protein